MESNAKQESVLPNYSNLLDADLSLYNVGSTIPFKAMKPINFYDERKSFFDSSDYEPVFRYEDVSADVFQTVHMALDDLDIDKATALGRILERKKQLLKQKARMIEYIGSSGFTKYSVSAYGEPSEQLVRSAYQILRRPLPRRKKKLRLKNKDTIDLLRNVYSAYKLRWEVTRRDMITDAAVSINDRKLYLNEKTRFSETFVKRLIVHEIGTHVLRAENGRQQPFLIFSTGFPGYLSTEEGLAAYLEEVFNVMDHNILRIYAGRTIAVNFARNNSFRQTFHHLRQYFPKYTAFKLTARAKRGLTDTSKPGCFTRDHVYLKGYFQVKEFYEQHQTLDPLMYGKIGIEDVGILEEIPDLRPPKYNLDMIKKIVSHRFLRLYLDQ